MMSGSFSTVRGSEILCVNRLVLWMSDRQALLERREETQRMTCDDVRPRLLDYQRGQLSTRHRNDIRAHLQACPACHDEVRAEALLTEILERHLPQYAAPLSLKRRLAAQRPRDFFGCPDGAFLWQSRENPGHLSPSLYEREGPIEPPK